MRIFRSIRRNSVNLGKVKNYLVYALGEIILISIGVLIAWKINNANEIKKSRAIELKIYNNLREELDTNIKVIDSAILHYTEDVKTMQKTLNYVGLSSNELTAGAKDTIILTKFKSINLVSGAVNSIITTKFEMLESDVLKKLIVAYPNDLEALKTQEVVVKNIVANRIQPILEKHLSLVDVLPKESIKYEKIRISGEKSNYSTLLQSKEYQNSIIDRLVQSEALVTMAKSLRKKTLVISINLDQELN